MRSVLRRPVLLLSAVATITVPATLALLAVLGPWHEDSATGTRAASIGTDPSRGRQQQAAPPGDSGKAPGDSGKTAGGNASRPAPGTTQAVAPAGVAAHDDREIGTRLLNQAVVAGRTTSYQGEESIVDATLAGRDTLVASVWHPSGGPTVTQLPGGRPEEDYDGASQSQEGIFGVTATLVRLLEQRYVPVYIGTGSVMGRPALVVAVRRDDGSTAAQFWLDERTLLPLRREVQGTSGQVISDDQFTRVRFGATRTPGQAAGPGQATWAPAPSPVQLLSRLNGEGVLLPRALPGDLSLYAASTAATRSGQVTDFSFSDGLSVVSVYVERGVLPSKMPGWRPERISGRQAYVAQQGVTMSGRGFVYTLIADASPKTVAAVVGALPANENRDPGFLGRLSRGLGRLIGTLDPFG
ncbi:MAG: hypothetical protein J2P25_18085 [Nocardiopsaceae bacterium]|nr:hypothetical protein [Nocardiopsaceae bacterium]